jgi:hypothetical protein
MLVFVLLVWLRFEYFLDLENRVQFPDLYLCVIRLRLRFLQRYVRFCGQSNQMGDILERVALQMGFERREHFHGFLGD